MVWVNNRKLLEARSLKWDSLGVDSLIDFIKFILVAPRKNPISCFPVLWQRLLSFLSWWPVQSSVRNCRFSLYHYAVSLFQPLAYFKDPCDYIGISSVTQDNLFMFMPVVRKSYIHLQSELSLDREHSILRKYGPSILFTLRDVGRSNLYYLAIPMMYILIQLIIWNNLWYNRCW